MKIDRSLVFFFLIFINSYTFIEGSLPFRESAVTIDTSWKGRFGDYFVMYCKAKILAHKYGLQFLYSPFQYSDRLVMHREEKHCDSSQFKNVVYIGFGNYSKIQKNNGSLYVVHFNTDLKNYGFNYSLIHNSNLRRYSEDLYQNIKYMFSALYRFNDVFRPDDKISVALHVRRGGGIDKTSLNCSDRSKCSDVRYPNKFSSLDFCVEQLKNLSALLANKPLYVHIFTDDKEPQLLLELFETALEGFPIVFATRLQGNGPNVNVMDDFFAMQNFDCLIRPGSYFSRAADITGDYKIVLSQESAHWCYEKDKIVVDSVGVRVKKD